MSALTIQISDETLETLDRVAAATNTSRAELISRAIDGYLQASEADTARIREGLAAAEAGNFAGDDEVSAVFQKYARTAR